MSLERCELDVVGDPCRRLIGHSGLHRATWHLYVRCGFPMPRAGEPCARRAGHDYEHRSDYAMGNKRSQEVPKAVPAA